MLIHWKMLLIARRHFAVGLVAAAIALSAAAPALAGASMQIAPILLDLQAPAAASTIDLTNQAPQPASIQVRVFAWTQVDGKEGLTPTNDVVASPPFATIAPGAKLSIRVIRAAQTPLRLRKPIALSSTSFQKRPATAKRSFRCCCGRFSQYFLPRQTELRPRSHGAYNGRIEAMRCSLATAATGVYASSTPS
jgi:Pili and flagellar-assembly chaperone, PapD N-terminal domain